MTVATQDEEGGLVLERPKAALHPGRNALGAYHRRNRECKRAHSQNARRDREWFLREVTPKLDAFALTEIAKATGLFLAACSRFVLERAYRIRGTGDA